MAQEAPESPTAPSEEDPLPPYPEWQRNGLKRLVDNGVIGSPEVWVPRYGEPITVGELFGILGLVVTMMKADQS